MRPCHPAEASIQLVGGVLLETLRVLDQPLVLRGGSQPPVHFAIHRRCELISGRDVHDLADVPARRAVFCVIGRNILVFHQRGVPLVGEDGRPHQPQSLLRIEKQRGIRVRVAGRVGQQERLAPRLGAFAKPRAPHHHIVRRALARPVEPAHEQVTARQLHDHRCVIVPMLQREDELRGHERSVRRFGDRATGTGRTSRTRRAPLSRICA